MKLSLIIPVYNTAKYLRKCLDSCLNQNIAKIDYEIILINDGSTDESHSICLAYIQKYSNFKYIQQGNSGQSVARNKGIEMAIGEYIWFIDSDDWIKSNCFNSIIALCESHNLDILRVGFKKVNEEDTNEKNDSILSTTLSIKNGKEILKSNFVFGPPLYIFKRSYLIKNQLTFYPNIFHEDNEFTPKALYFANRIGDTEAVFYYYLTRNGSTTLSVNPKKCFDLLIVCQSLVKFSKQMEADLQPYINNVISTSINSILSHAMKIDTVSKIELKRQLSLNNNLFGHMRKAKNIKFKIEGFLFFLFPNNILELYRLLKI